MIIAGDKALDKAERATAKRKYNMLEARRTAQLKAVRDMKSVKGNNWSVEVTRVALDHPVEKRIPIANIHDGEKGKTLSIDLKLVQEDVHIDAIEAKTASSSSSSPLK